MTREFFEFLRFPSISADPSCAGALLGCAEWLLLWLHDAGLRGELVDAGGPPVVYARTPEIPGAPRILLYGHYDVQPAESGPRWQSPPFEPTIREGLIHARGSTDNKGQTFSLLLGLRDLSRENELRVNVIVVIEGEEEVGSPHFAAFLESRAEELACDAVLIADTSMIAPGRPAITNGLRGIACFEVEILGPLNDLHSGMFGGAIPNPALLMARLLAGLVDADGRIAIPGFYDGIIPPSPEELQGWESLPWTNEWFHQASGTAPTGGESGFGVLERVWTRPTFEINGLTSGHQGAGSKTIIPSKAQAKLSFRLVPGQDLNRVRGLIEDWFVRQFDTLGARASIAYDHGGEPFFVSPKEPALRTLACALEDAFGKPATLTREGLSIPAAVMLQHELKVPVLLTGLGMPDCQAHGPDESFPVEHIDLGRRVFRSIARKFAG